MILKYDNCPNCFEPLMRNHACSKCGYIIDNLRINENIIQPFTVLNDNYLLGRTLGQGGFGITYVAQDMRRNKLCAIKEYMPSECAVRESNNMLVPSSSEYVGVFENGKGKFLDEARTLYQFSENPVVVTIYDYFKENNTAYLVMELLDGVNMKILSRSYNGKIPLELAKRMLVTIAESLNEIHSKGILHRDISPENIFITKKGEIRLIDFGAARNYITNQNNGMSVLLKPGFAPPEQYNSQGSHGPWTDIYALAASFYTLVSGQKLIDSILILRGEKQPSLYELNCGVSLELSNAIEKAMSLNYQERYQDCFEFLEDINEKHHTIQRTSQKQSISVELKGRYVAYIKALSGNKKDSSIVIPANKLVNIGRSYRQSDFVVDLNSEISRVHCSVSYDEENNNFRLIDKSANGTFFLDGQRLTKGQVYIIKPGERFYIVNSDNMLQVDIELASGQKEAYEI